MAAGALPNLIVIGAQKCGTTSLHYYLSLHPQASMSRPKELNFFVAANPGDSVSPDELALIGRPDRNWDRGVDWYAGHFSADAPVRGEASPDYTAHWDRGVAERIAQVVPDTRLIFLVRDPIARAISHYAMHRFGGSERRDLETALAESDIYLARSRYWAALEPYARRFRRSQVLIVDQADLLARRRETVQAVYRFAGIDETFWSDRISAELNPSGRIGARHRAANRLLETRLFRPVHRLPERVRWSLQQLAGAGSSRKRPAVSKELREKLAAALREDVSALRHYTGMAFESWSV